MQIVSDRSESFYEYVQLNQGLCGQFFWFYLVQQEVTKGEVYVYFIALVLDFGYKEGFRDVIGEDQLRVLQIALVNLKGSIRFY